MVTVRWWTLGVVLQLVACGSTSKSGPSESPSGSGGQQSTAGTTGVAGKSVAGTSSGGAGGSASGGKAGANSAGEGGEGPTASADWSRPVALTGTPDNVFQLVGATEAVDGGAWVAFGAPNVTIARFTAADGWAQPAFVGTAPMQAQPRLATSAKTSLAIWVEPGGGKYVVASALHDGTAWKASGGLDMVGASADDDLELAMNDAGVAVAAWIELVYGDTLENHQYTLKAAIFDGSAWSAAATVASRLGGFLAWPRVAIDAQGHALALWRDSTGGGERSTDITASRFHGSAWSTPEIVSSGGGADAYGHDVALHADGSGLVVWRRDSLRGRAVTLAGGFGPEQELAPDRGGFSALSARPDGSVLVTSQSKDEALVARHWLANGSLDEPFTVSPEGPQIFGRQEVAVNASGTVVVTWPRSEQSQVSIQAALQQPGAAWGSAATLDFEAAVENDDFTYPSVALNPDGTAIVAWVHTNGDGIRTVRASASLPP